MSAKTASALFLIVTLAGGAGLMAMADGFAPLMPKGLKAQVVLEDFPLPEGFGLEPQEVSDFLVTEMQQRVLQDVALRITMGNAGQQKLHDVVIPRLLNAGVIRKMIDNVRPLEDVLSIGHFQSTADVTIRNDGDASFADVAITLPGAGRVEADDGSAVPVVETSAGITAVALGELPAGATRRMTVWREPPADFSSEALSEITLGAADGVRGQVAVIGAHDWFGASLESVSWGRWLVGGLLTGVTAFGLLGFAVSLRALMPKSARSVRDVTPTSTGSELPPSRA